MILAYCNQKGGVGKSTTLYHHTRAAVLKGMKVLVVDADPQGNSTTVLTEGLEENTAGLADALSERSADTVADVLVEGIWEGVTVVPTVGAALSDVRNELIVSSTPGKEARLRKQLQALEGDYDLILIDSGPAIDPLTISALTAADKVVIATQSKLWSANGLGQLLNTIALVQEHYNPDLVVGGVLLNAHEPQTLAGAHWALEIGAATGAAGIPMLVPAIPKRQAIADASETSMGLDEGDTKSRELARHYSLHLDQLLKETN